MWFPHSRNAHKEFSSQFVCIIILKCCTWPGNELPRYRSARDLTPTRTHTHTHIKPILQTDCLIFVNYFFSLSLSLFYLLRLRQCTKQCTIFDFWLMSLLIKTYNKNSNRLELAALAGCCVCVHDCARATSNAPGERVKKKYNRCKIPNQSDNGQFSNRYDMYTRARAHTHR